MARWAAFHCQDASFAHDPASLKKHWARLHAGDAEPLPKDAAVLAAWCQFHAGHFQQAHDAGLKAAAAGHTAGITVANKAQSIHATYLEPDMETRLAMFQAVAARAEAQKTADPRNPGAHYWLAYALGRYAQGISVAKALSQGLGPRIKTALETTIALSPRHADAHVALGAFHAEVIDKVGRLLGRTQGADAATGLRLFEEALVLHRGSAIARLEQARALEMLEGGKRQADAVRLRTEAAACVPADAMEWLDVQRARRELGS